MTNSKQIEAAMDVITHYHGYTSHHVSKDKSKEVWLAIKEIRRTLQSAQTEPKREVGVDRLAQEIRRLDGQNNLGAGALAEGLMSFLSTTPRSPHIEHWFFEDDGGNDCIGFYIKSDRAKFQARAGAAGMEEK